MLLPTIVDTRRQVRNSRLHLDVLIDFQDGKEPGWLDAKDYVWLDDSYEGVEARRGEIVERTAVLVN